MEESDENTGEKASCEMAPRAANAGDMAARASGGIAASATNASGDIVARDASAGDIAIAASGDNITGDFKRRFDADDSGADSGGVWLAQRLRIAARDASAGDLADEIVGPVLLLSLLLEPISLLLLLSASTDGLTGLGSQVGDMLTT